MGVGERLVAADLALSCHRPGLGHAPLVGCRHISLRKRSVTIVFVFWSQRDATQLILFLKHVSTGSISQRRIGDAVGINRPWLDFPGT